MEMASVRIAVASIDIKKTPNSLSRVAYKMDLQVRPHIIHIDHHMKYYKIETDKTDSKLCTNRCEMLFLKRSA